MCLSKIACKFYNKNPFENVCVCFILRIQLDYSYSSIAYVSKYNLSHCNIQPDFYSSITSKFAEGGELMCRIQVMTLYI